MDRSRIVSTVAGLAAALLSIFAFATVSLGGGPVAAADGALSASVVQDRQQDSLTVEPRPTIIESGPGREPFDVTRHTIPLDEIVGGGPTIDGIPALGLSTSPRFVGVGEADWLDDDDLVIGVRIGDAVRAYPIKILNYHEAANDSVVLDDGTLVPFAVVWCPLCGSATVMSRRVVVDGEPRVLQFGVSGKLYNANVLLYDRQTHSLWSQFTGGAVTGPLAGTPYELLPSEEIPVPLSEQDVRHTTWKDWRERYPDTRVLAREGQEYPGKGSVRRDYDEDPYSRMPRRVGRTVVGTYDYHEEGTPLMFEPRHVPDDSPIDLKARVVGIWFGGDSYKAYPLEALEKAGGEVTETVNGRTVTVRRENDYSAEVVDADGNPVPVHHTYWFAWYAFHPDTELFWPE